MRKTFFLLSLLLCAFSFAFSEEMPENYYLHAQGLKDGELKDTLKAIITRKHKAIPYGNGTNSTWEVFYYSDRDEEGYCMDMYCDTWYKFAAPGSVVTGCNIEHSFAKSWWGGAENYAYKDCYHLNPSNSTANSARGNFPLGIPQKDIKTSGSLRIGKIHHDSLDVDFSVFEPKNEYKGDFARAYFYMATRYGHWSNGTYDPVCSQYQGWRLDNKDVGSRFAMQNDNYLEFQPWEQEVLITWHRQDPVSVKEIKRADAVSDFQHNRNPFIDYPYLVEYIWGEMAGEEVDMANLMGSFEDDFIPGTSNGWRDGGVTPTPKPKFGVTWSVNGEELYTDSVVENKKVSALPATPTSCSTESNIFMGWTTEPIDGIANDAPATLYTKPANIPAVTEDITLYAVFAKRDTAEGGEPATYIYDKDHQTGWVNTASNKGSYWLLETGKTLISPLIDLTGLSSITAKIRTYGNKSYNTLIISANGNQIGTITTSNGSTLTECTWTKTEALSGKAQLTFSSNYGNNAGIGFEFVSINATGSTISTSRYITSCQEITEAIPATLEQGRSAAKILIGGHIYLQVGEQLFTITGQRVQ